MPEQYDTTGWYDNPYRSKRDRNVFGDISPEEVEETQRQRTIPQAPTRTRSQNVGPDVVADDRALFQHLKRGYEGGYGIASERALDEMDRRATNRQIEQETGLSPEQVPMPVLLQMLMKGREGQAKIQAEQAQGQATMQERLRQEGVTRQEHERQEGVRAQEWDRQFNLQKKSMGLEDTQLDQEADIWFAQNAPEAMEMAGITQTKGMFDTLKRKYKAFRRSGVTPRWDAEAGDLVDAAPKQGPTSKGTTGWTIKRMP